jgi:hypothetical protein
MIWLLLGEEAGRMEKLERRTKPKKPKKDLYANNPNIYGYESLGVIASAVSFIDGKSKKNKKVSFITGLNGKENSNPNPSSKPTLSLKPKSNAPLKENSILKPIVSNASAKEVINPKSNFAPAIDSSNLAIDINNNNSQDGTI